MGFALELVQADVIARYNRLVGNETCFQTGTDENALKNVLSARRQGLEPAELVDRNSRLFCQLADALRISYDAFIRTTDARHRKAVHTFWKQIRPEDIYTKAYEGLYCTGCEDFYLQKDLLDGCCPEHGTPPVRVEERNYFFRLSAYQQKLEQLIAGGEIKVIPKTRKNEVLSFIRGDLQDISISRDTARACGWGIDVPGDRSQVVYVWIDALINYISGRGFGSSDNWRRFWCAEAKKIHVIGKNVWKFHAVYWPAMLLSADLPLPNEIVVHGFVTAEGGKIGKSLNNTVDPFAIVDAYGTDALRFYLLRAIPAFEDGDFSLERFKGLYNTELANGLGNLVGRITALCEKAQLRQYAAPNKPESPKGFVEAISSYEPGRALAALWETIRDLNRDIETAKPWESLKAGDAEAVRAHLVNWLDRLGALAYWLAPLLPETSAKIAEALRDRPIKRSEPLFPRAQ